MNPLERLLKPEYIWQPSRLVRRVLGRSCARGEDGTYLLPLPWNVSLQLGQLDELAKTIDRLGVYDLVVTEAIFRLIEPRDTVIDVGANVGYMSLAMAARLGSAGRIFAFEPHPKLFEELERNAARARARFGGVDVHLRREAVSDVAGSARLSIPEGFTENRGLARIGDGGDGVAVITRRLDDCAAEFGVDVALMKIDVEGHESAALRGAASMLERGTIRHVIMEEHGRYPTAATALLESFGYEIFTLERSLFRACIGNPSRPRRTAWEPPSLLATRHANQVRAAFRKPGWRALASWAAVA